MNPDSPSPPGGTGGAGEASVTGLVSASGRPLAEAVVMIVQGSAGHPDIAALSNEDGQYRLGGLAPGSYTVEAQAGQRSQRARVTVGAGQAARLDFAFD